MSKETPESVFTKVSRVKSAIITLQGHISDLRKNITDDGTSVELGKCDEKMDDVITALYVVQKILVKKRW